MKNLINISSLDQIIQKTALAIEDGKKEIFDISERARHDYTSYEQELMSIKAKLTIMINEVDKLEIRSKMARNMIKTINEHFDEFTENDIKEAYALSQKVLLALSSKRQEEKEYNERRNELERLMRNSVEVIKKSEILETKVSVALEYLTSSVFEQIEDIKQKKDLSIKIIEAQENEKKRISRDIHDGPAQSLANVIFKAEYASKIIDTSPVKAKREIAELQEDVRDTLKDIRKIIYDLMPMSLDDLGLVPTIKKLISNIMDTSNIIVDFNVFQSSVIDNQLTNLMVFRVIQEAFNNIVKHSHCKHAKIDLHISDIEINVMIEDDGVGFDVTKTTESPLGFGLYNMKERIEIINGTLEINSTHQKGTIIKIRIPNN
ncbi:histidine kinase [Fusibacter bizertensis]|uniref:histidine kinase n=1 Tax=Fusibacter bizertensis TaxID=1488331 RepID=A0ABT6NFA2_9FIRM|nr:sensor histidine kinase [Fusibacter bizertensis]MDH8679109.1 histidine kinase [Fusibacter bizertensis]